MAKILIVVDFTSIQMSVLYRTTPTITYASNNRHLVPQSIVIGHSPVTMLLCKKLYSYFCLLFLSYFKCLIRLWRVRTDRPVFSRRWLNSSCVNTAFVARSSEDGLRPNTRMASSAGWSDQFTLMLFARPCLLAVDI